MKVVAGVLLVAGLIASGCGQASSPAVTRATPGSEGYDGPLYVAVDEPDAEDVLQRSGAAGRVLECEGAPYNGSTGSNWGVHGGGADPTAGLESFLRDARWSVPATGYRVEQQTEHRSLFTYAPRGDVKVAVVVVDKPSDQNSEAGWAMESYAQCDPAEFDPAADAETGHAVWTDKDGRRVPVRQLHSAPGAEHCGWQEATFLDYGGERYVRDPEGALEKVWLAVTYDGHADLPEDARDTGFRLGDQQLFEAADGRSVYVRTGTAVERWPLLATAVHCY